MKLLEKIVIKSYKHGGALHRTWRNGILLDENNDFFVVGSLKTEITEANGGVWEAREPAITLYSKTEWFNVVCMFKEAGISYYANIASPTILSAKGDTLKFIDYDVDIRLDSAGKVQVVDLVEFRVNSKLYSYPDNIIRMIQEVVLELIDKAKAREFPFNNDLYISYLENIKPS